MDGTPLGILFPHLFKPSRRKGATVRDAVSNRNWVACIKPNPDAATLTEYLQLWELLDR